jgi:chromate transporter
MKSAIDSQSVSKPSIKEAFLIWLKIGVLSFGGPAAQIALMHRLVVAQKRWLTEKQYLNALSFCMLLPGPEAMQLATYAGWRLHGTMGGLIAGLLFVLPGACVIAVLAYIYALYGDVKVVSDLFLGVKAAVIVVVLEALLRVSKKSLTSTAHWVIALFSFIGIFFLDISYPLIVLMAALYGYFRENRAVDAPVSNRPNRRSAFATIKTIGLWCLIWAFPIVLIALFSDQSLLLQIGSFFSRLAVVTFGGAYAVLAYLGQEVVSEYRWLNAGEMMDGLGLAETTPGPLILVVEFVGFIAGFREGGPALAVAAALLTLWVTFVPCFLWIFAGAPYIEWICEQPRLKGALSAITAAVVGVILNLSLWFALHVIFGTVTPTNIGPVKLWLPDLFTIDWTVILLTVLCALAAFKLHWPIVWILLASSILGLLLRYFHFL